MRPNSIGLIFALIAGAAWAGAQQPKQRPEKSPEEFTRLFEEKSAKPWIRKGAWLTDFDEACAQAKKQGKLVFAYFTRSYAY